MQPYRQQPTRLLCPQNSLGKNTGVGCHFLPQKYVSAFYKYKTLYRCQLMLFLLWVKLFERRLTGYSQLLSGFQSGCHQFPPPVLTARSIRASIGQGQRQPRSPSKVSPSSCFSLPTAALSMNAAAAPLFRRVQLFSTPWTASHQAPLSMGFPRQDYWSGLHFLLQEFFPTQRSNPCLLCLLQWQADSLPLRHLGSP